MQVLKSQYFIVNFNVYQLFAIHKTKTCLEALCHYGQRFFFFSVIKTPGGHQMILDRAFWFFFEADYGTLLYSL